MSRTSCFAAFAFAVLGATGLVAQSYRYSPSDALTNASSGNTFPWNFPSQRYQQVHGDLRGVPMLVQELGFRRGNLTSTTTGAVARTLDAEVFIGDGNYATSTPTFATNFISTPLNAITRKMINLPDITMFAGNPAPFVLLLPFDNPFVFSAINDLVWEIFIYNNTSTGAYFTDATNYTPFATTQNVGAGCFATGQTNAMLQQAFVRSVPGPSPSFDAVWRIFYGPLNTVALIMLGATGVNVPVPGLCTNLYVSGVFHTFVGLTMTANGVYTDGFVMPFDRNLVNVTVHAQGFAVDMGHPLGVAATQGVNSTVVDLPTIGPVRRIYGGVAAVTGTTDTSLIPLPYGLVVRFRH